MNSTAHLLTVSCTKALAKLENFLLVLVFNGDVLHTAVEVLGINLGVGEKLARVHRRDVNLRVALGEIDHRALDKLPMCVLCISGSCVVCAYVCIRRAWEKQAGHSREAKEKTELLHESTKETTRKNGKEVG